MVSELAFVAGPIQDPRLVDLAEALALEVRRLGLAATIEREAIPARKAGRASVVLDRCGWPSDVAGARRLPASWRPRSRSGRGSGATTRPPQVPDSTSTSPRHGLGRRGVNGSSRSRSGWSRTGPRAPLDVERDIDLAVIGAGDKRSGQLLAEAADELSRWRVAIAAATDPRAPDCGPVGYQTPASGGRCSRGRSWCWNWTPQAAASRRPARRRGGLRRDDPRARGRPAAGHVRAGRALRPRRRGPDRGGAGAARRPAAAP